MTGEVAESELHSTEGDDVRRYSGGPYTLDIDLTWTDDGWVVIRRTDLG